MEQPDKKYLEGLIERALNEDIGYGDITTNALIPVTLESKATMVAKAGGIIAGMDVAASVFRKLSPGVVWNPLVKDGDKIEKGTILVEMSGPFRALLSGERLALNFLQRMSGIATLTGLFVEQTAEYGTKILDTRKTVPGLRLLDKYAVKAGGVKTTGSDSMTWC
jgi:nicotinate-nucleotide pyrophosphorylase (carboxylating)